MTLLLNLIVVDYGSEPHLLNNCYGGVEPFGDPGRMVQNLSFIKPILCYVFMPTIRCDFHCCLRACLVAPVERHFDAHILQ